MRWQLLSSRIRLLRRLLRSVMSWWTPAPRKPELQRIREEAESIGSWLRVIAVRAAMQATAAEQLVAQVAGLQQTHERAAEALEGVHRALDVLGGGDGGTAIVSAAVQELRGSTDALARAVAENQLK